MIPIDALEFLLIPHVLNPVVPSCDPLRREDILPSASSPLLSSSGASLPEALIQRLQKKAVLSGAPKGCYLLSGLLWGCHDGSWVKGRRLPHEAAVGLERE